MKIRNKLLFLFFTGLLFGQVENSSSSNNPVSNFNDLPIKTVSDTTDQNSGYLQKLGSDLWWWDGSSFVLVDFSGTGIGEINTDTLTTIKIKAKDANGITLEDDGENIFFKGHDGGTSTLYNGGAYIQRSFAEGFCWVDTSLNKNITTWAEAIDTAAVSFDFGDVGQGAQFLLADHAGRIILIKNGGSNRSSFSGTHPFIFQGSVQSYGTIRSGVYGFNNVLTYTNGINADIDADAGIVQGDAYWQWIADSDPNNAMTKWVMSAGLGTAFEKPVLIGSITYTDLDSLHTVIGGGHYTGGLKVDNNITSGGFIQGSVSAGLTAVNPGVQGDGALTAEINEISTVGTTDDARTLPVAVAGRRVYIINNGANQLELWPASGDNAGGGVDTAITLAAGANLLLVAYDATNWETF